MDTPASRSFASDNNASVHPLILQAIAHANVGHALAYGADPWTDRAQQRLKAIFGPQSETYFVFNGTAANVLGLRALTQSHHAVLCSQVAHIYNDECGAPEHFTGCKLLPAAGHDGKLRVEDLEPLLAGRGDEHHVQPRVISISQSSELGTVYRPEEVRAIADFAHARGLFLHMDGARLSNAAASLGLGLREISGDCGVDVLSFGGTKNGMLCGEAVVLFRPDLAGDFKFIRKQGMQLSSKMRFLSAQFEAFLDDGLWLKNAAHANQMAVLLANEAARVPGVRIVRPVQANGVFATLPRSAIPLIQKDFFFYVWDASPPEVRWMTSFDTTSEDVQRFSETVRKAVSQVST